MINLGTLEEIKDLREVWSHEAHDFTPWLAKNISILGDEVGIDISIEETESSVGDFNVDIFATDADTGKKIIIENQLEETDHNHLGKLITYASGKSADLVIWLVRKARPEHRAAIEWLNNHTDEGVGFILCEIKVFRIGNSEPAPKFEIIEQPNNWVKEMKKPSGTNKRTVLPKIKDMLEWGVVKGGDILAAKGSDEEAALLQNGHVSVNDEEMSIQDWLRRVTGWKSVETYKFAIHKEMGKTLSQIRKEYMDENMEWLYDTTSKEISFDEFHNSLKRMSETALLLQRFQDKKEAIAYLMNETGLPVEECTSAYDIYMKMFDYK